MAEVPESYPEDVREAFEYCPDCETITAQVKQHDCPPADGHENNKVTADEREELAEGDERPPDELVLYSSGRSNTGAWAYHELDGDGMPLHEVSYQGSEKREPRAKAKEDGCYPCGRCRIIQERREDDG